MKNKVLISLLTLLLWGCSASKEPNCYKRAIKLSEKDVRYNIFLEYTYLDANYKGYSLVSHKQDIHKNKKYEIIVFRTKEGRYKRVYFTTGK